jgi:hypothetical protein
MQWQPQKPASPRAQRVALVIAAIPITLLVIATLVLIWQLLGQPSTQ